MNSHQFGRYVEDLFEAECLFRGIILTNYTKSHPFLPYDFTTVIGHRKLNIQVKGVRSRLYKEKKGHHVFRVKCHRKNGSKQTFHDAGVSLMAIFVEPLKRWHILPPPNVRGKIEIAHNPTGRMLVAIDRWDLLGADVNRKNTFPPQIVKTPQPEFIFG